jgi:hypothetical protein
MVEEFRKKHPGDLENIVNEKHQKMLTSRSRQLRSLLSEIDKEKNNVDLLSVINNNNLKKSIIQIVIEIFMVISNRMIFHQIML